MDFILRCKICGVPISGCYTCNNRTLAWRNVACSPEHFQDYMKQVEQSRNEKAKEGEKT